MTDSINFAEVWKFIKKHQLFFYLAIPVFLCIFLRVQTYYLPGTDDIARSNIVGNIDSYFRDILQKQYPYLPADVLEEQVLANRTKYLKENNIQPGVEQLSQQYKNYFQDENGRTYLLELDPYLWYQRANNIVNHGYAGEEMIDGKSIDTKMRGRAKSIMAAYDIHPLIEAVSYQIMHFFNKNLTLMQACFMNPVIMMTLATIIWFFIGRLLFGNVGGLITSTIIAVHPAILQRTIAGFADTDAYYILFPGIAILFFLYGINQDKRWKQILLFGIAGLSTSLLHELWGGWYYIELFLLISSATLILKDWKTSITAMTTYFTSTLVFSTLVIWLAGYNFWMGTTETLQIFYKLPMSFINLKAVAEVNIWPNVMTTVAELNPASSAAVLGSVGSTLFFLAVFGVVLSACFVWRYWKNAVNEWKNHAFIAVLMLLWLVAGMYAGTKSVRFVAILVMGVALAVAYFLKKVYDFVMNKWTIPDYASAIGSALLLIIILVPAITNGYSVTKQEFPLMNDDWYNSLTAISKDHGSNPSIVLTYWDEGHFIKVVGNTSVFFDGGDQGKRIYWSGRFMLSNNPEESRAILKMIDCNTDLLNDKYDSQTILDEKDCKPYEEYLLLSDDLISKAGVWAHFGSWNFTKARMYYDTKKLSFGEGTTLLREKYNISEDDSTSIYYDIQNTPADQWISPWPGYIGGWRSCNNQTICQLNYNLGQQNGQNIILNSVKLENSTWKFIINNQVTINETDFDFGVIFDKQNNRVMIADKKLKNSLFTRLYLLDETIPGYEKLESASNNVVKVWKVKQ